MVERLAPGLCNGKHENTEHENSQSLLGLNALVMCEVCCQSVERIREPGCKASEDERCEECVQDGVPDNDN